MKYDLAYNGILLVHNEAILITAETWIKFEAVLPGKRRQHKRTNIV